jgi:pimeloyl-ACP methyl ester carboxylesterase
VGSDGGTATGSDGGADPSKVTVLLAGDNVNANGPLQTTVQDLTFSGGGHILVRPTTITKEPNTKHPVAIWGPGGGTPPRDYLQLLTRMASQGFVVVGIRESSGGSELMSAAIDWLEKQNADSSSPMFDRLILNRVGVFGHSMGGLSSEATIRADKRVTTALLDNSGDLSHSGLVTVKAPVGIIYGEDGMERPNAEADFDNTGNKGPCWRGMMAKGGHGSGPWDGAGANVAWMRWHIGGENSRKAAFIGTGGDYNNKGVWTTKFKNWDGWKNWNE